MCAHGREGKGRAAMWRLREETKIRVDENCRDSDSRGNGKETNGDGILSKGRGNWQNLGDGRKTMEMGFSKGEKNGII